MGFLCYTLLIMELRQKIELRRHLVPELRQSLNILALPTLEIRDLVEKELESNPLLEEVQLKDAPRKTANPLSPSSTSQQDWDFKQSLITQKISLQDMLLRQLAMFTNSDEDFRIGQEIIGNIDENGYLKAKIEEISATINVTTESVENVLKLIQQFEPAGVGARTVPECLLIQLKLANEQDPLLIKIVESLLEDVAKKNYRLIAKVLKAPLEKVESSVKKLLRLNPKPGANYSTEETQRIIPDITIEEKEENLEITLNNADIPNISINHLYQDLLKKNGLDDQTKEFLTQKLRNAQELIRAISKRQDTLRRVVEAVVEVQQAAIREDFSYLKPLTFNQIAQKVNLHESTVCRAVMNKYVKTPYRIVALKDFFASRIYGQNGESVSSVRVKRLLKELIKQEYKQYPLSDQELAHILSQQHGLNISRRTVAKYREELKILSTTYRKER